MINTGTVLVEDLTYLGTKPWKHGIIEYDVYSTLRHENN
jgi:hypothetical protein